jgi:hypothetical protein
MNPQQLIILGRIVERSATWALAALLLFFAYKLASTRRSQPTGTAELKWNDILIKLARISPGVFFAILGAVILATNLRSPLEMSFRSAETQASSTEGSGPADFQIRYQTGTSAPPIVDICVAINRVDLLANTLNGKDSPEAIGEIQKTAKSLMAYRDDLLSLYFTKKQIQDFRQNAGTYARDPKSVPAVDAAMVQALQRAYQSTETLP